MSKINTRMTELNDQMSDDRDRDVMMVEMCVYS